MPSTIDTPRTAGSDPSRPVDPSVLERVHAIMARPYHKVIVGDTNDGFLAAVSELPGCMTAGETEAQALELLHDAMELWLISAIEDTQAIPEPSPTPSLNEDLGQYSGKMVLRMPRSLHRDLAQRAKVEDVSINQLAATLIARGLGASS